MVPPARTPYHTSTNEDYHTHPNQMTCQSSYVKRSNSDKLHKIIGNDWGVMKHDYMKLFGTYAQMKRHEQWKKRNTVASHAGYRKRQTPNYRAPEVSSVVVKFSKRLRSCSKANVSGGVGAAGTFTGGAVAVEGGVEEACFFAATDAGTKDIIDVGGFLTEASAPLLPALLELKPGPLGLFFDG